MKKKGMEKIEKGVNKLIEGTSKKCMSAEGKSIDNTLEKPRHEEANPPHDKKGK